MRFHIGLCLWLVAIILGAAVDLRAESPLVWPSPLSIGDSAQGPSTSGSRVTLPGLPQRLTLKQAMDLLVQRNLAVAAARYDIDAARAARLVASLRPNPIVTVGAEQLNPSISPRFLRGMSTDNLASQTTYTTRIDQVYERGNKRRLRTEVANYNVEAAEAQLLDILRQALFNLKQAFYTTILAKENLQVAQENLAYFEQTEKLIKISFEAGAVAEVDLIRVRTQRVQYQRDYTDALKSYQQSLRDMLNLLGVEEVPPEALAIPQTSSPATVATTAPPALLETGGNLRIKPQTFQRNELRRLALTNRPDVLNARKLLAASNSSLMLARSLRRRDISAGMEYQRVGSEGTLGVIVQFPLFVFNNQQGAIDQAVATMRAGRARLRQAELQAMTEVDKAFSNYELSQQLLKTYSDEYIKGAEEARNIEEYSYRAGHKSLIEFLDAQRAYNQARVAINQARFDYRLALYQIEQAVGATLLDEDRITEFN
ncbi:MAG: TolC family protein [Acidobacteria bacterium]|nr:TolC family protein [Acidobacteriota bacterium]MBI3656007.1 TolC family protein [Acidobacteriota bacterium]